MQQEIQVGALDPLKYELTITSDDEFDLSLVTAQCVFEVLDEDKYEEDQNAIREWAATPSNAQLVVGGSSVVLTHVYQPGDVPEPGTLKIRARIVHPSYANPLYSRGVKLVVVQQFSP